MKHIKQIRDYIVEARLIRESFYIYDPEDTNGLVDVIDNHGNPAWVREEIYIKHKSLFDSNLSKYLAKKEQKEKEKTLKRNTT